MKILKTTLCAAILSALIIAGSTQGICAGISSDAQDTGSFSVKESGKSYGGFEYDILSSGTVEIKKYNGQEKDVVIPDKINGTPVTYIGWNAFKNCNSIESVTIPSGVTAIGKWAFFECKSLKNVTIPDTVSSISAYAFAGCDSLESVSAGAVRSIGESAFASCSSLEKAVLPDTLVSINEYAFFNCPKLTIYCYPETQALSYAEEHEIPFILLDGIKGDVDSDGTATSADALLILRSSVGLTTLSPYKLTLADINSDGTADSADALEVLRRSISG